MEVSSQLHAPAAVPLGKEPLVPIVWLGGPQSRSGHGDEEKNSQALPGFEPPYVQLVAQCFTTELTRLYLWYVPRTSSTIIV
jgi:hypothetical protein